MKNYLMLFCVLLSFTCSGLHAAASVKMMDYMLSSSGLVELLGKNGIKGSEAKQVGSYVSSALSSFGGGKSLSQKEFSEILNKLPVTGEDATIRKELQVLLDRPQSEIKKEDVVKAINHIIYLSNRHGKSVIITCADCVSEGLARNGFKFTVENITSNTSKKILNDLIPDNPRDLQVFISSKVKRLGLGDYSKISPETVQPFEEKTLALFLSLYESGSPQFRELGLAIKKLSTRNGKTNLFDPGNPNKLWKVVSYDMGDAEAVKMTDVLKQADVIAKKEDMKIEEAFNSVLKKKAETSDELMTRFKAIKSKRCFFK